jgi:6-pyruvoyltetrahydropterin/6-carboxytetrahydropterin synthase
MDASFPVDVSRAPETRLDAPIFVPCGVTDAGVRAVLREAAEQSGCRVSADLVDGRRWTLEGTPDALHQLRNRLLRIVGFDALREAIEWSLAERAAPAGLPRLDEAAMKRTTVAEEMPVEPGTTLLVSKDFYFDAAHNLPRYAGKCEHLHGHTFRLRVTLEAPLDAWSGMAFDFMELKRVVDERIVRTLDHAYVNEIIPNPSAEFIAIWIWRKLAPLPLHEVKVWETPTCFVTYRGPPARRA